MVVGGRRGRGRAHGAAGRLPWRRNSDRSIKNRLRPVRFAPPKKLDLSVHKVVFRRLGLWEFAHLKLDSEIRSDLLAVFLENYNRASKLSVIGGFRIKIGRANLARASKLPVMNIKKGGGDGQGEGEGGGGGAGGGGGGGGICSCYVLLHNESGWTMPDEVSNWLRVVKDIWAFAEA